MPGRPDSTPMPDHDWGATAVIAGCENRICRCCAGLALIAATPIMPLPKLESVAVALALPPGPVTLQVIWLAAAVAVSV
jgi:hypothetical protein